MAEEHSGFKALNNVDMNSKKIINLATPTDDYDASTKKYVDDNAGAGLNRCRVYRNGNVSHANNTWNVISYNAESHDGNNMHDNVTNPGRITIQESGYYWIHAQVSYEFGSDVGGRNALIMKNGIYPAGTRLAWAENRANITGHTTTFNMGTLIFLSAGDYITCSALQSSGGNLNLRGAEAETFMEAIKLTE